MKTKDMQSRTSAFVSGMRDGLPIALGYFAVSFSLGITARNIGLNAFQGFLVSLLNLASAGEYAGFVVMEAGSSYLWIAMITLVTNARYLLMSCALSQKLSMKMPFRHRFFIGFAVTDELFGIAIAQNGYLHPWYFYGAMAVAVPCWSVGTALGVIAGNILPLRLVSALSVALYGMFLASIIPPARKNTVIAVLVAVSFATSYAASKLPVLSEMSDGTRTILLTVILAAAAALLFPLKEEAGPAEAKPAETTVS